MTTSKENELRCIHSLLGVFFTISGLIAIIQAAYLMGIWVISLGMLFIFFNFQERLAQKKSEATVKKLHIILALLVMGTGALALLKTFRIL